MEMIFRMVDKNQTNQVSVEDLKQMIQKLRLLSGA